MIKQISTGKEPCSICKMKTSYEKLGVPICSVCVGKYQTHQLKDKLDQLDIKYQEDDSSETLLDEEIKIEGSVSFGNKASVKFFIETLMDQYDISAFDLEEL